MTQTKTAFGMLDQVEVISVRMLEGAGKLRAFVDIRVGGALVITQCAVIEGKRGKLEAILPRQLARDGRWRDVIIAADAELRGIYEAAILEAYDQEINKIDFTDTDK